MAEKVNFGKEKDKPAATSPYVFGECYAHDMIGNFCSAPIMCDTNRQEIMLQPAYYFICHFSRFVAPGSVRIAFSKYCDFLEVTAFLTPQGKRVVIVMNTGDKNIRYTLKDVSSQKTADFVAEKKSICTIVYKG